MSRDKHEFHFQAAEIAKAAEKEANYHEQRVAYWQEIYKRNADIVRATAKIEFRETQHTGGSSMQVVVNYGDAGAYGSMSTAWTKWHDHEAAAKRYRSEQKVYETQDNRTYELSNDDVHYFNLSGARSDS